MRRFFNQWRQKAMDVLTDQSLAHSVLFEFILEPLEQEKTIAFNKILRKMGISAILKKTNSGYFWEAKNQDSVTQAEELFDEVVNRFDRGELTGCMRSGVICYVLGEYHKVLRDVKQRVETLKLIHECGM